MDEGNGGGTQKRDTLMGWRQIVLVAVPPSPPDCCITRSTWYGACHCLAGACIFNQKAGCAASSLMLGMIRKASWGACLHACVVRT